MNQSKLIVKIRSYFRTLKPRVTRSLRVLLVWIKAGLVIALIGIGVYYLSKVKYSYDYTLETELKYWTTKSLIIDEVDKFIKSKSRDSDLSPIILLNKCDEFDIDIRLALVQGTVESNFGTKGLASRTNSIWNMGAFDGHKLDAILGIYKYSHPNKSITPYLKNIRDNYLGHHRTEEDLLREFTNKGGRRYASYDKYEEELKVIWEEIDTTTNLDSLLSVYKKYRLELNR